MTISRTARFAAILAVLGLPAALLVATMPGEAQQGGPQGAAADAQREFLVENAKKPGWQQTASGLQYRVVKKADDPAAPSPAPTDAVLVHYEGRLIDGTVFDSSHKRGKPLSFTLNRVIPGWTEGVQLMKAGETFEFAIPGELAYGPRGVPQAGIGPNATLLFTVELLEVVSPLAQPPR